MALHPHADGASLHLPRILCLHGGGTNSRIFRMQCRSFNHVLGRQFRFVFAEAPFPSRPGPDVTAVYAKFGPFRTWTRPTKDDEDQELCAAEATSMIRASIVTAIREDSDLGATGEVIGVLGFSQGARVAASLLHNQQLREERPSSDTTWDIPIFRFGVLIAGRGRLLWLTPDELMPVGFVAPLQLVSKPLQLLDDRESWENCSMQSKVRSSTIHVHGLSDAGLQFHRLLLEWCCLPAKSVVVEWQGGHNVPIKTKDVSRVGEEMLRLAELQV
ncbi:hypothetical protein L249_0112 [Ophiocordyceps polyrhachis-furcata BCC 54312]|uniref:Serine hydrolase domain-containing protein n=1 Tax=Ophiocordyceps polyrhachis-furcata BCC 54312 TaxID=1330021 RepID=A0A367LFT8_9HYPO|nr:hypothetical protein L249_0112 [Ophiocordyceps polyrhachis-furcata BCC 54312]